MSCTQNRGTLMAALAAGVLTAGASAADYYFGMLHAEMGQATLQSNLDDTLTISNIGSSGQDGVTIHAGNLNGFDIGIDVGQAGALPAAAKVAMYTPAPDWCTTCDSCIEVFETAGGEAGVCYMSNGFAPTCVRVELRLAGQIVDVREYAQPIPPSLVTGPLGSVGSDVLTVRMDYSQYVILPPQPQMAALNGSPAGPVLSDEIVVIPEGLPPGEPVRRDVGLGLLARNFPSGLVVRHEGLRLTDPMTGDCCRQVRAVGAAHIEAEAGDDLCLGLPEYCAELENAPELLTGLKVSNLGSSGCDGYSIIVDDDDDESNDGDEDIMMRLSPTDIGAPGGSMRLEATGTLSGQPDRALGHVEFESVQGQVQVRADYSAIGSTAVIVEVRDNGVLVGSRPLQGGPGVVIGTLSGAAGVRLNKCGKLGAGGLGPPCFTVCTDAPIQFDDGTGVPLTGNDFRFLSSPTGTLDSIESLTMLCSSPTEITAAIDPPSTAPVTIVARGMPVTGLGEVEMNLDPQGRLVVSNIGSSGCDGVSIDLGESDGGGLECADCELVIDSSYTIDIYDDQCPACPDPLLASVSMVAGPGGDVVVSPNFPCCLSSIEVTPRDAAGNALGSFSMSSAETFSIRADPGDTVSLAGVDARFRRHDPLRDYSIVLFEDSTGTMTVTDPSFGAYLDVNSIVITVGQCSAPQDPVVTRLCMTAANVPSMIVSSLSVAQNGLGHTSIDGARLEAQYACEGTGAPRARLKVSNLGSSGCDGYSVAYDDDDSSDDDVLDEVDIVGASFVLDGTNSQDDGVVQTFNWTQIGGPIGAPDEVVGAMSLDLVAGERALTVLEPAWLSPAVMDVAILDDQDQVLDEQTGLPVGVAAFYGTARLPGTYEFELEVADGSSDLPLESRNTLKTYFQTGTPRIAGGSPVPGAAAVRVIVRRTGGGSGGSIWLRSGEMTVTSAAPGPAEIVISNEQALAVASCDADLDGSGDVGFGDILRVIAVWGPCAGCAEDLSGNGAVDFADILLVIAGWGACQ